MKIYEAGPRNHDPATNYNLYGEVLPDMWFNYGTHPTEAGLEKSKELHPHVLQWKVIKGFMPITPTDL